MVSSLNSFGKREKERRRREKNDLSYCLLSVCEYLLSKTIDIDYEYSNLIMSFISVRLFVQKQKYSDEKVGGPGETQ